MNLQLLTLAELIEMKANIETEITYREAAGNGFDKEFSVTSNGKAFHPATYKQFEFAESLAKKTDSVIATTGSQIVKRMGMDEMSEAIGLMRAGKRIKIY